ncbi:Trans-L-3-hydroxyproline dehydratase, partial [Clydaea vesicula]
IDRSPCGSGIQARMATFYSKNSKIKVLNKTVLFKSIIHSKFKGKIVKFFDNDSSSKRSFDVLVEVSGTANYTGLNHFLVEDNDSLGNGFLI